MPAPDAQPRLAARFIAAIGAVALIAAASTSPAFAEEAPEQQLKAVEKALESSKQEQSHYADEATALAAEVAELRGASIATAREVQQHEAALSEIEAQMARLAEDEAAKSADLQRRSGQSVELLMALQRLARDPPEALALAPGTPLDAARGAILLGAAIPQIEAKARALRDELKNLAELRESIAESRRSLLAERDALAKQQLALETMTARKAVLQEAAARGAEIGARQLTQLSLQASDLRDLIARLEAERQRREAERRETERRQAEEALRARAAMSPPRPNAQGGEQAGAAPASAAPSAAVAALGKPAGLRPFSEARGALLLPASGTLTRRFGENDEFGAASKGLVLETRPSAQVVAPFDGRIEFAGPFRGYGQILIIEHGDGYHSLLAGLERIEGVVGQWLVAGEPVGVMPSGDHAPSLYLELRRHGQPINPLPWLATRDDKVSG
ncbi:MAG: peptidoglycan DD-metalloendopeptidase family protein [Alphaproteobacteria bacterium]|nr:peptidoglycan DD-metalloendopeptidase family protein [Alphaproteobacteria bacterium]